MNKFSVSLVSCGEKQLPGEHPAKELYLSNDFQRLKKRFEEHGIIWYILSTEHGLVHPEKILRKYDKPLSLMTEDDIHGWVENVFNAICLLSVQEVAIHDTKGFRAKLSDLLARRLQEKGIRVKFSWTL
jgi:hypothetical protein